MSSSYNTKNYTAHGGAETVIGGKLTFLQGAQVEGLLEILSGSPTGLPQMPNQALSEATTIAVLKEDFNSLLSTLVASGLMAEVPLAPPEETEGEPDLGAE